MKVRYWALSALIVLGIAKFAEDRYRAHLDAHIRASGAGLEQRLAEANLDWSAQGDRIQECKIIPKNFFYRYLSCFEDGDRPGEIENFRYTYRMPYGYLDWQRLFFVSEDLYFKQELPLMKTLAEIDRKGEVK